MNPLILIAGPCVVESWDVCSEVAEALVNIQARHAERLRVIFKSSFDKANRTSIASYRGIGIEAGIEMILKVSDCYKIPVTTDFHTSEQVSRHGGWFDVIQIPALLSRQTDFLASAAMAGPVVNVKKGQWMRPDDAAGIGEKLRASRPGVEFWITERGTCFGPGRLVVDFTGFDTMRRYSDKVIIDCTHSNNGKRSDGAVLARCGIAAGVDGIFLECHPEPDHAKCDGPNSLALHELGPLVEDLINFGHN